MGAAVGLTLELAAWAVFSALGWRAWVWLWPLAIVGPFAAVPRWRRHWRVRGYAPTPIWWSWAVTGVVTCFTSYLSVLFLQRNPILPTGEDTRQYLDFPYHLSLAGEMTHRFPPNLPQVAGEPLHYHWFGHVHMAMMAMVGGIDLPVVALRLAVPSLSILAIVLSAVVGWRIGARPDVGAVTAVLFWVIGDLHFAKPVPFPFGPQGAFVIWHGISLVYSWVLLFALITVLADVLRVSSDDTRSGGAGRQDPGGARGVPGPGAYVLVALLAFASGGAKASSLPVVLGALGFAAAALLVERRRLPGPLIAVAAIVMAAVVFAIAVLFGFQPYTLKVGILSELSRYWRQPPEPRAAWEQWLVVLGVWTAYLMNMQLRLAGIVPLVWLRRARLHPVEWFLLGGALTGIALHLSFASANARYFTRAGLTFGVIFSACGYALVCDRARLSREAKVALAVGAVVFALALVGVQVVFAGPVPWYEDASRRILPILQWAAILTAAGVVAALVWRASRPRWPALRGRGAAVTLTAILVAGAPGLVMDAYYDYNSVVVPFSRVEAARWVRGHSGPDDVLATNVHCLEGAGPTCDPRSFWLSAYAERTVLVEGWGFAPRIAGIRTGVRHPFWDPALLRLNDEAFTGPTPGNLAELRDRHGVRWLVADRTIQRESAVLRSLARLGFDNGRMAVYELRPDRGASQR
jgi:hypothetical protein